MSKRVRAEDNLGRQILLRSPRTVEGVPEYNMIELNGTIAPTWEGMPVGRQVADKRLLQDQELGEFSLTVLGKPQLVIGSHRLIGKVEKLREPVAILRKRKRSAAEAAADGAEESHFLIAGVVREKYVFKERPKPVLNKWNVRAKEKAEREAAKVLGKATMKEARLQAEAAAAATAQAAAQAAA
jgi:chromosome transmission fidelity protein 8